MAPLTIYLGKLLGLYCIITALAMMANKRTAVATINALLRNPPLMLLVDIVSLVTGLALVIGHNVWSGGALPIVVTLVGWVSLVKGLVFLALSGERTIGLYEAVRYEKNFYALMGVTLALGVYLTVAAFLAG